MLFSSLPFIFLFMPLFFITYFVCKKRYTRNIVLLIFSLVFYAWGEPLYILLMLFSIGFNFVFALLVSKENESGNRKKAKILIIIDVILNLALIIIFKYTGFFISSFNAVAGTEFGIPEIALPIGISFYTFQIMSYVIDVYRGDVPAQRDVFFLGAYLCGFPQLIAGPVVRYETIADELVSRKETLDDFADGMRRFICGLSKKVLIANVMAMAADGILGFSASDYGIAGAWIAMLAYAMQIYFDFSGYSDMAIGMGRMMGFHYLENFNYPYIAKSVTDFWRRWHISLSTFFRDYVYIPLGGNRVSTQRWVLNMMIVWACTGFWHGASLNFIVWGGYFGVLLILEKLVWGKYIEKIPVLNRVYALICVLFGWVIFRSETMAQLVEILKAMVGGYGLGGENINAALVLQRSGASMIFCIAFVAAVIVSAPVSKILKEKLESTTAGTAVIDVCAVAALVFCVIELAVGSYNPFIYFRF